jgi:hypothetical protein
LGFVVFTNIKVKTDDMRGPCRSHGGTEIHTDFFGVYFDGKKTVGIPKQRS